VNAPERQAADEAIVALYAGHYRELVRLGALLLGDASTAEEVVQDAYVNLHRRWGRVREPDKALAYLRRCVVNGARDRSRRAQVARAHSPAVPPEAPSAEHEALTGLQRREILTALAGLSTRQRETLVLRYYADLTEAQIAEALGISPGAVKTHASRGLTALRERLDGR
jgi:RNA polymerase sigma-70 factor (sigma-E family)